MGLFDEIDRLTAVSCAEKLPALTIADEPTPSNLSDKPRNGEMQPRAANDHRPQSRARQVKKPQPLSFLRPCPVCQGRDFLHLDAGGFVCQTCQPGFTGIPVEAAGQDRPAQGEEFEDIPLSDRGPRNTPNLCTTRQKEHFAAGWPWIKENMPALLSAGWTRPALLRRSRHQWPYGKWGAAWLPVWSKPSLEKKIGASGQIIFSFESNGRIIVQTLHPPRHS